MSRFRPSPALVVATLALIVALGGTGYAAFSLPKNSVGAKQLKNKAVTTKKLADGAVTGAKVNLSSLGTVPNAAHANVADTATNAASATTAAMATSATTAASATTATNANQLGGQAPSAYALSTPLTPTRPALVNGWTDSSSEGNVGYAKDQFGIVHLFGDANNGTANADPIFTLPPGDRPGYPVDVPVIIFGPKLGELSIQTNGSVGPFDVTSNVELEGVTFAAGG